MGILRENGMMTREEIGERMRALVVNQLGVEESEARPEASFVDDLGMDSPDIVKLVMMAEEEFHIEIPDEDAEKVITMDNAIDYIWGATTPAGKLYRDTHPETWLTREQAALAKPHKAADRQARKARREAAFPHAKDYTSLHPMTDFRIGDRTLSLYTVGGRMPGECFSLYFNDETSAVQHNMTAYEVFWALHGLLEPED